MRDVVFEWDSEKSSLNEKKHGVIFEEASSVFYDVNALVIADTEHSIDEDRFLILGMSTRLRMVVVCHCYRENDEVIRIISARKADAREVSQYERLV